MTIKNKLSIGSMLTTYIPMLCSLLFIVHCILDFIEVYTPIFNYIGGTSLLVWVYFLYNSYLYNLCIYQRMFIYYLIIANIIAMIDTILGIPISDLNYLLVYFISFGITVLLYGYFKYQENKKKKLSQI